MTSASPPKFVSLEEIMKAAHGVRNMALFHEIAFDPEFKLEPFVPPDDSYHKLVKDTMHRAFFDILRNELNSDPPEFKQALVLLEDVKMGLFSILMPRHTNIRQMIEEMLDAEFIKQQVENGALDFHKYSSFVIDMMSKLAAPCRDEMIEEITKLTDTVDVFKAILETLEVLKLDLANTLIAMIRPQVQAQSVQYEKDKFENLLKVQEDGLELTREWLHRHIDKSGLELPVTDQSVVRNVTAQTLAKAYLELLEWESGKPFPETMVMDEMRFIELADNMYRMVVIAAVVLVGPTCSATDPNITAKFKQELKHKIYIILHGAATDKELVDQLPSVAEQVIKNAEDLLHQYEQESLSNETRDLIRNQIVALADPEHRVRQLVRQRTMEFLKDILVCGGGTRPVPFGLTTFKEELTGIAGTLLRYAMHNKAVYSTYYHEIVETELAKS